jgi:hypothetical protein
MKLSSNKIASLKLTPLGHGVNVLNFQLKILATVKRDRLARIDLSKNYISR